MGDQGRAPLPVNVGIRAAAPTPAKEAEPMTKPALILLCTAAVACGVSKDKYAAKELEAEQAKKMLQEENDKASALEAKVQGLEAKLAASQKVQAEIEAKSSQYEQLAKSLEGQIEAGQVELSELKGKMTVKLKDRILFSSGSAKIGKEGKEALDAVAAAFKDLKGKNVVVAGYTDDVPMGKARGYQDNWALSSARAAAVVRYLASKGVDPRMLGAAGFSEYRPLVPNDSAEGRSQNRRIEIALTAADYQPPEVEVSKGAPAQAAEQTKAETETEVQPESRPETKATDGAAADK
jgi:chemotaxis protein MotB